MISQALPLASRLGGKDWLITLVSSSEWRKGSLRSSLADNRSETFAMHFSINALTPGSFTFVKDAGLIPFKEKIKRQLKYPPQVPKTSEDTSSDMFVSI